MPSPGKPEVCMRETSVSHAMCMLEVPCPLHDPPRSFVRVGQFSLLRFVERVIYALVQGALIGWWIR